MDKISNSDEFSYNNIAHNILCEIIKRLSGFYVDEYLRRIFFREHKIKIRWDKQNGIPHCAWGLNVEIDSLLSLSKHIVEFSNKIEFGKHLGVISGIDTPAIRGIKFIGHNGSGGQYFYYNTDKPAVMMRFMYNDPETDERPEPSYEDVINFTSDLLSSG